MLPDTTTVKKNLLEEFFFWACIVLSRTTFTAEKCCNEVLAMQMLEVCQECLLGACDLFQWYQHSYTCAD